MIIPYNLDKTLTKSEFKKLIKYLREEVLPNVKATGQPFFYNVTLKYKDLVFRPKRWTGELIETDIKNSKDNRDASIKPKSKKLKFVLICQVKFENKSEHSEHLKLKKLCQVVCLYANNTLAAHI